MERLVTWAGSGQLLQPGAGQLISGGDAGGICPYQLDQSSAGDLGGERRAPVLEELLHGQAGANRVGPDRWPADVGLRRDVGAHRGEGDVQAGALCLVLGVSRDEALRGLGAGVPATER
jgi:hypothetical protein